MEVIQIDFMLYINTIRNFHFMSIEVRNIWLLS